MLQFLITFRIKFNILCAWALPEASALSGVARPSTLISQVTLCPAAKKPNYMQTPWGPADTQQSPAQLPTFLKSFHPVPSPCPGSLAFKIQLSGVSLAASVS